MEIIKYLIHIKLTFIIFLALPFAVITMITSKTDLLFGVKSFVVLTGSMGRYMPQGSLVYTIHQPAYKLGDVITFRKGSVTVTHRVVGFREDEGKVYYKTRGDANRTPDPDGVTRQQIIGRELFHLPNLGKAVQFIKTPPGFISFIIVPSLIFIGFELWQIKKEFEKEIEKKVKRNLQMQPNSVQWKL